MPNRRTWSGAALMLALTLWALPAMAQLPAATTPTPSAIAPAQSQGQPSARDDMPDWQARLELARLLSDSGQHAEAADEYRRVLQAHPDLAPARAGLARSLFWSGHPKEALAEINQVPSDALTPDDLRMRAELLLAAERPAEAVDALRAYLERRPDDLEARLKLADALSWTKRLDESLAQYERILTARPDDQQVRRAYARVLTWAGRNDDAIRELRKSLGQ